MDIQISKTKHSRLGEADFSHLGFGEMFTDHMLSARWSDGAWGAPEIGPFGEIALSPAVSVLHYGQAVFEGLKAFHRPDGVALFRPQKFYDRLVASCARLCIPPVEYPLFIEGIKGLVRLDSAWVPRARGQSLYIRPFIFASESFLGVRASLAYRFMIIASPVGAYYKEGMKPVRLVTSTEFTRAAHGGLGFAKTPANYASSLFAAEEAKKKGYAQVIWLDAAERKYVEEVGAMNIFFLIGDELITPPLEGTILAGVTRDSVIAIARRRGMKVSERKIAMDELFAASAAGTLKEAFGSGTAAVISPVGEITHEGKTITVNGGATGAVSQKLFDEISGIQYGDRPAPEGWMEKV